MFLWLIFSTSSNTPRVLSKDQSYHVIWQFHRFLGITSLRDFFFCLNCPLSSLNESLPFGNFSCCCCPKNFSCFSPSWPICLSKFSLFTCSITKIKMQQNSSEHGLDGCSIFAGIYLEFHCFTPGCLLSITCHSGVSFSHLPQGGYFSFFSQFVLFSDCPWSYSIGLLFFFFFSGVYLQKISGEKEINILSSCVSENAVILLSHSTYSLSGHKVLGWKWFFIFWNICY